MITNNYINNTAKYIKIFIKYKIEILPPKQSDILIYDDETNKSGYPKIIFKSRKKTSFHNKFEKINLFILLKSLIFKKFNNIKKSYIFYYFNYVNPKIIYTSAAYNPAFFLLKHIYPNAKYIADQDTTRDNIFYNYCLSQIKNNKKKFICDYYFVFGDYEYKRLKKIIKGKIIIDGNTKNNFIKIKKQKKQKIITYISSKISLRPDLEKKIFNKLIIFCKKFNYKLFFLDRPNQNNKNYLIGIFGGRNWKYVQYKNNYSKYKFLSKSELIAFAHSTLGYQFLSRGHRCISFNHNYYNYSNFYHVKQTGKFWCSPNKYKNVESKILEILNYSNSEWKSAVKLIVKKILFYNNNNKKKKIINTILNNE